MNIPTFYNAKFVHDDGFLTDEMHYFMEDFVSTLRGGLSNNGFTLPQLTTAQINQIAPNMPNGTMWYDVTVNEIKAKVAGIVRVIALV